MKMAMKFGKVAAECMKDGTVFLNFARDLLVNDDDLEAAIESGKIKRYVTDFPNAKTANMKNVIAIPHLGASTANKFGKKEWCCMGAGFAAIVFGILFFFPVHNPVVFIVINGICYLGASGMQVLIWAMVNDAIDYHELQTGERNEGIVYSTYSFFRKLASAISGSLSSFVLGAIGYNVTAGAVQTAGVVNAIWKSYTGVYFLGYGIAVAILFFVYPLTKQKTAEMLTELKARRAAKESK